MQAAAKQPDHQQDYHALFNRTVQSVFDLEALAFCCFSISPNSLADDQASLTINKLFYINPNFLFAKGANYGSYWQAITLTIESPHIRFFAKPDADHPLYLLEFRLQDNFIRRFEFSPYNTTDVIDNTMLYIAKFNLLSQLLMQTQANTFLLAAHTPKISQLQYQALNLYLDYPNLKTLAHKLNTSHDYMRKAWVDLRQKFNAKSNAHVLLHAQVLGITHIKACSSTIELHIADQTNVQAKWH